MPRLTKTETHRHAVELFFTDAEMKAICKAASAKTKMRLQWIIDAVADALEREQSATCEHGIDLGMYCPECRLFEGD